jgi:hypothetical protein
MGCLFMMMHPIATGTVTVEARRNPRNKGKAA